MRPTVTIINKTGWNTRHLRAFVTRCRRMGYGPKNRAITVIFAHGRGNESFCSGRAWYNGSSMRIWLASVDVLKHRLAIARGALKRAERREKEGRDSAATTAFYRREVSALTKNQEVVIHKPWLAMVIAHELAHLDGIRHREMNQSYRELTNRGNWSEKFSWADDLPLEPKTPPRSKVKPEPLTIASQQLLHAQSKVKEWKRKKKRAETGLRKWRQKVKYYERRQAALRKLS